MTVTSLGRAGSLTSQVAEEIRAMMGRRRVTGARLARELHVSQAWVSDRLRGITPMTLTDLERIAEVLGVAVLDLLPRSAAVANPPTGQIAAAADSGRYVPPGTYGHPKSQPDQATPKVAGRTTVNRSGSPDRVRPRDNRPSSHPAFPVLPPTHRRPVPRPRVA